MEMGSDAKTSRLTWRNILSIYSAKIFKGSVEPNKSCGRKYWNWAIIGITKCTGWRELIAIGDNDA